jgi:hypothetical protein
LESLVEGGHVGGEYTKDGKGKLGSAPILTSGEHEGDAEDYIECGRRLLDRAEQIAKAKGTTREEEVRQWLDDFGESRWKLPPHEPRKRKARKSVKD